MDWASIVFGAFLGVAGLFLLTSLALIPVLKRSFLAWSAARTLCFAAMALFNFPIVLPDGFPTGAERFLFGELAVSLAVAFSPPLLASYLERDLEVGSLRRELYALSGVAVVAAAVTLPSHGNPVLGRIHDALLLFVILATVAALVRAIRAGSRKARYQLAAWSPLIIVGLVELLVELVTGVPLPGWSVAVLIALVVDFLFSTLGVVDGFMIIAADRDRAVEAEAAARVAVSTDPLTGIANRRGLALRFRDPAYPRPSALAVLDCDHFKSINDQYGHDVGDEVLVALARALEGPDVFAARLGGEEFVLLLYGQDWEALAEKVRRALPLAVLEQVPEVTCQVTASVGLTPVLASDTLVSATKRADRALYKAKDSGRDQALFLSAGGAPQPRLVQSR